MSDSVTTPTEPRTEAGRDLLDGLEAFVSGGPVSARQAKWTRAILAIEAEAASQPEPAVTEALALWIDQETRGKDRIWDHACLECTGPTSIVIDGFRCAVHQAQEIVRAGVTPSAVRHGHAILAGTHEPAVDDFGNQYLAAVPAPSPAPAAEPSSARQRYLQALMDEYDAYDWEQSGRLDEWLRLADAIEAEARAASPSPAVAPLDVERLDKAITDHDFENHGRISSQRCGEDVAERYARLTAEASEQATSPGEGEPA